MKRRLAAVLAGALVLTMGLTGCKTGLEKEPDEWKLPDFEGCFEERHETAVETYTIGQGTAGENTVTVLRGQQDGPTVYIVAGVHGDEQAGWRAGNMVKDATVKAGTVYIVSPANRYGAEHDQRRTKGAWDLNRNFPGDPNGWDAEQIAHAIFTDIQDKEPVIVLDLHEAIAKEDDYEKLGANYDALGNSLICQSLDGIGDLVLEALLRSEQGQLCANPLILYGSPPSGSVNETVTNQLGIPAITVETLRTEPLSQRVQNQLEIVEFVFEYYGLR